MLVHAPVLLVSLFLLSPEATLPADQVARRGGKRAVVRNDAVAVSTPNAAPITPKITAGEELLRTLQEVLDMEDFIKGGKMTLKEALGLFYEKFAFKGKDLPILVNTKAFAEADPESPDLYEASIEFPPYPKKMTLAKALRLAYTRHGPGLVI